MQWRNSISIICSEQSFSFTDIPLLYSLMHFQTSISLFIINLGMFCLTLSYIPPFSIKALSGEMLSSCLPKTPPPHPFPIKHSCWCSSSVSSPCCSVAWPTPQQPSSWPAAKLGHSAVTWRSPSCRSPSCEAGKQHHKPTSHSPVGRPHRHKRSHRSCCPVAFCSSPSGEGLTRHTDARACGHLGPLIAHWWESLWQTSSLRQQQLQWAASTHPGLHLLELWFCFKQTLCRFCLHQNTVLDPDLPIWTNPKAQS